MQEEEEEEEDRDMARLWEGNLFLVLRLRRFYKSEFEVQNVRGNNIM